MKLVLVVFSATLYLFTIIGVMIFNPRNHGEQPPSLSMVNKSSVTSNQCLLVSSYPPHFKYAAHLLRGIRMLASDSVPVFIVVESNKDRETFRSLYDDDNYSMATLITMEEMLPLYNSSLDHFLRLAEHGGTKSKCKFWGTRHVQQAMKKITGLRHIHKLGCERVFLVDSEALPLKKFSFKDIFDDFFSQPRILVTNCTHPRVRCHPYYSRLQSCPWTALGIQIDNNKLPTYRTSDYWIWEPGIWVELIKYLEARHSTNVLNVFSEFPASTPTYYGLYIDFLMSRVGHRSLYRRESVPEVFDSANVSYPGVTFMNELHTNIWGAGGGSFETRLNLAKALPWHHGWRFDDTRLSPFGRRLLLSLPSATWSLSNFHHQIDLPASFYMYGSNDTVK